MAQSPKKTKQMTIDGVSCIVQEGQTILDVCRDNGVEIPVFCAHKRLSIAGNCRMCLVEVEGCSKLVASCAMPIDDGMVVHTKTPKVKASREGTLELLLANHPLDCPVCDQGGMCDLQDITMTYGLSKSRFLEGKRVVLDKYMGPLIQTVMTRCIHCTRCVRFATDVAGVEELGVTGRGETMEITTYLEKAMTSVLSGNVIDLCPVGALNAKPSNFQSRPWELQKTESLDVQDAVGASTTIYTKDNNIMRILPRENSDVNEEWLTDKGRFSYDGLRYQRLDKPYIRKKGRLGPVSWAEALMVLSDKIKAFLPDEIAALSGGLADVESLFALRQLLDLIGVDHRDCRDLNTFLPYGMRGDYLFNTPLIDLDKADAILLVGVNPQLDAPLLNIRVRRAAKKGAFIGLIGSCVDLGYPYDHLSQKATVLNKILASDHPVSDQLKQAKKPVLILGMDALQSEEGEAIYKTIRGIAEAFGGSFNVLHKTTGCINGMDVGFTPKGKGKNTADILKSTQKGDIKLLYLLGRDDITRADIGSDTFVVYQGHHGDKGALMADIILPGAAYSEKQGLYINLEGRVQEAQKAIDLPGDAKEDWRIVKALSDHLSLSLSYNTHEKLRETLFDDYPHLQAFGMLPTLKLSTFKGGLEIRRGLLKTTETSFYHQDVIGRASPTMAKCVKELS
jgi:NADH-quinone oxidoreductase subunit G